MKRKLLSPDEITVALKSLSGWASDGRILKRRFEFVNFAEALRFVKEVGKIAESLNHHPDITFGWGYAEITTTTHDRGGITDFDTSLAGRVDSLARK